MREPASRSYGDQFDLVDQPRRRRTRSPTVIPPPATALERPAGETSGHPYLPGSGPIVASGNKSGRMAATEGRAATRASQSSTDGGTARPSAEN